MVSIDIFYIILGLFIGFMIIYALSPAPKIVLKYPTLDTHQNKTYIDENGNCYKYQPKIIPC